MSCRYESDDCSSSLVDPPMLVDICYHHWSALFRTNLKYDKRGRVMDYTYYARKKKPRTEEFKMFIHPEVAEAYGISDGESV